MRLRSYPIIPALQPFVKVICSMDFDGEANTAHIRVLPDSCVEIFINYTSSPVAIIGGELHKRSIVCFRMSKPTDVQMRKGTGCFAICFHPGMAYKFFRHPMHTFTDTTVELSTLWSETAIEIEEKLSAATNDTSRAEIIQQYLTKFLVTGKSDLPLDRSLELIHNSAGMLTVNEICDNIGFCQRHLARKFQHSVGLSPKEYLRICRFLHSLNQLRNYPQLSLTEVAYKSGYYDQAHFNHDYKSYAGVTPREVINAEHILY